MYCKNCGKGLKDDWVKCPYCGTVVLRDTEKNRTTEYCNDMVQVENEGRKADFTIGNTRINGRLIIKALTIIAMICFFCPLYMVSCAGQEVVSLSGMDMTFGFQYMSQDIEGDLLFGLLAILPFISFCFAFAGKKALVSNGSALKIKSYICAICSCSMVLLIKYFSSSLKDNTSGSGSGIGIAPCAALNIMFAVGLFSMVIGWYLAFLAEPRMKEGKQLNAKIIAVKSAGIIFGASLVIIIIISILFATELTPSTVPEPDKGQQESYSN